MSNQKRCDTCDGTGRVCIKCGAGKDWCSCVIINGDPPFSIAGYDPVDCPVCRVSRFDKVVDIHISRPKPNKAYKTTTKQRNKPWIK